MGRIQLREAVFETRIDTIASFKARRLAVVLTAEYVCRHGRVLTREILVRLLATVVP